jgi:yecA family protein
MEPRRRVGGVTDAFAYAELDEILRGTGRDGAIGMSAIDGLIAALVAAPSFVHPDEWIPLIFGGRQPPLHENSPELRAVKTIVNRYNEVSEILADQPQAYRPIFMIDDGARIAARDWAVGFALGIGLRSEAWAKRILLTENREVLIPILVYCEGNLDLLPEIPAPEKRRRQATAHEQIPQAVAAARAICNPYRAAEARRQPSKGRSIRTRRGPPDSVKPLRNGVSAPLAVILHSISQRLPVRVGTGKDLQFASAIIVKPLDTPLAAHVAILENHGWLSLTHQSAS